MSANNFQQQRERVVSKARPTHEGAWRGGADVQVAARHLYRCRIQTLRRRSITAGGSDLPEKPVPWCTTVRHFTMAMKPFSGFPVAPSSPRNLMDVDSAKIHTQQIESETSLESQWGERYRAAQERKMIVAAGIGLRPKIARPAASPRHPSSSAQARLQGGWMYSNAEIEQLMADIKDKRDRARQASNLPMHRPMIASPRHTMPSYYGSSLHGNSATGTDPRAT